MNKLPNIKYCDGNPGSTKYSQNLPGIFQQKIRNTQKYKNNNSCYKQLFWQNIGICCFSDFPWNAADI